MKSSAILFTLLFLPCFLFSQQFERITTGPVVSDGGDSRSVNWVDSDNDGDLDLFITNGPKGGQNNFFYLNDGDGGFTKIDSLAITQDHSPSDGSSWGDFNNDGHPDLFVANWYNADNLLYINHGGNRFSTTKDISSSDRGYSESGAWIDLDNDGFLDLTVANSAGRPDNFVYRNNTMGEFQRVSDSPFSKDGGSSRQMDWADYNDDGFPDLFVANENDEKNFLYRNDDDGTFIRITEGSIVNDASSSFGSSWGDYDNDGDLDLFVANWNNQHNFLYNNGGEGTFERITEGSIVNDGGHSISSTWGDIDNDGDLDLFVTNGFSKTATVNFLYINSGDGTFSRDSSAVFRVKGWSYGASFGDYNGDGFLDLAVAKCFNADEKNALFQNIGGSGSWIVIKLRGTVSNRSGIGAIIRAKATVAGKELWQMRHVSGQSGYCGQNLDSHFGFADATVIDSLLIQWPTGQKQHLTNVAVNQVLEIVEPQNEMTSDGY